MAAHGMDRAVGPDEAQGAHSVGLEGIPPGQRPLGMRAPAAMGLGRLALKAWRENPNEGRPASAGAPVAAPAAVAVAASAPDSAAPVSSIVPSPHPPTPPTPPTANESEPSLESTLVYPVRSEVLAAHPAMATQLVQIDLLVSGADAQALIDATGAAPADLSDPNYQHWIELYGSERFSRMVQFSRAAQIARNQYEDARFAFATAARPGNNQLPPWQGEAIGTVAGPSQAQDGAPADAPPGWQAVVIGVAREIAAGVGDATVTITEPTWVWRFDPAAFHAWYTAQPGAVPAFVATWLGTEVRTASWQLTAMQTGDIEPEVVERPMWVLGGGRYEIRGADGTGPVTASDGVVALNPDHPAVERFDPALFGFDPFLGLVTASTNLPIGTFDRVMDNVYQYGVPVLLSAVTYGLFSEVAVAAGLSTTTTTAVGSTVTVASTEGALAAAAGSSVLTTALSTEMQGGTFRWSSLVRSAVVAVVTRALSAQVGGWGVQAGQVVDVSAHVQSVLLTSGVAGLLQELSGGEFRDGALAELGRRLGQDIAAEWLASLPPEARPAMQSSAGMLGVLVSTAFDGTQPGQALAQYWLGQLLQAPQAASDPPAEGSLAQSSELTPGASSGSTPELPPELPLGLSPEPQPVIDTGTGTALGTIELGTDGVVVRNSAGAVVGTFDLSGLAPAEQASAGVLAGGVMTDAVAPGTTSVLLQGARTLLTNPALWSAAGRVFVFVGPIGAGIGLVATGVGIYLANRPGQMPEGVTRTVDGVSYTQQPDGRIVVQQGNAEVGALVLDRPSRFQALSDDELRRASRPMINPLLPSPAIAVPSTPDQAGQIDPDIPPSPSQPPDVAGGTETYPIEQPDPQDLLVYSNAQNNERLAQRQYEASGGTLQNPADMVGTSGAKPGADGSIPDVPGQWVYVDQPRSNGVGGAGQLLPGYEYQQRVTGVPTGLEYRLGGLVFDSVDHGRRILIETKDYAPAWNMPEYIEDKTMEGFVAGVIEQQRVAEANGYTLEIRVSSEAGAERIRTALEGSRIDGVHVVHTPK